ncbi:glycosyltransferase family 25 protein [Neisseria wadsworthii]|uniref:Lacto-N-neotetraose biosynthesis glycosyl transferase LgtB n=1 Tax=Neisseria wadsworthii 9715 TaxID=1030841 RepID=G4CNM7_9NEIS|nr:glycosyltransferase family 25 protein [Neisseria wadsworthii]EGZ49375.1 lacto-N-neotetraose biosynthesis glycosyl transferase LgtB [Neisseria wadsworthii 9715]QMT36639.1 glycosyltransferase family 25 protein [Neisseria wadsworthii]
MLHNFVISISSAYDRRNHIQQEFSAQNIPFEFFDAMTPCPQLDQAIQRFVPNLAQHQYQISGEKACFMSHILLFQKCIDANLPYIAVFEDDILLGKHADAFLAQDAWLLDRFSTDSAFVIKVETHYLTPAGVKFNSGIPAHAERNFAVLSSVHGGSAGYIISQQAIRFILKRLQTLPADEIKPIDILLFGNLLNHGDLKVYQLVPALCVQESQINQENSQFKSQLQLERAQNWHQNPEPRKKRTFKERCIRAFGKVNRILEKRRRQIIPFQ